MKHKLIIFGFLSGFVCYMDISLEDATRRYVTDHLDGIANEYSQYHQELEFTDEFEAYDIYDTV